MGPCLEVECPPVPREYCGCQIANLDLSCIKWEISEDNIHQSPSFRPPIHSQNLDNDEIYIPFNCEPVGVDSRRGIYPCVRCFLFHQLPIVCICPESKDLTTHLGIQQECGCQRNVLYILYRRFIVCIYLDSKGLDNSSWNPTGV